jgi:hypothetical protein
MAAVAELPFQPQQVTEYTDFVRLAAEEAQVAIARPAIDHPLAREIDRALADRLERLGAGTRLAPEGDRNATIKLRLIPDALGHVPRNRPQSYLLDTRGGSPQLTATTPFGLYYGVLALCQLLGRRQGALGTPELKVRDWPDFAYRGLFVEPRWGADLMGLDDWKALIDTLARLRCNVLTISLHSCWPGERGGEPLEHLFVPFGSWPELNTTQRRDYYSPQAGDWVVKTYLPRMFAEDLLGHVVAYGSDRGVMVRPHWGGVGQSTLIPRVVPEISAQDARGNPKGYGYCLANEATLAVLFELLDDVVNRCLTPNGIEYFHIGGERAHPRVGVKPGRPYEHVSPWCECSACGQRSPEEQHLDYVVRVAKRLVSKGIRQVGVWCDELLHDEARAEALHARLDQEGLAENLVLQWSWRSDLGARPDRLPAGQLKGCWVSCPTGDTPQRPYRSRLNAIYRAVRAGREQEAEGVEGYGPFDPVYDRDLRALAEYAWNVEGTGTPEAFCERYARDVFGGHWKAGLEGFRLFDSVAASPPAAGLVSGLVHSTYRAGQDEASANIRENYPQWLLRELAQAPATLTSSIAQCAHEARKARQVWERDIWADAPQQQTSLLECRRLELLAIAMEALAIIVRSYQRLRDEHIIGARAAGALAIGRRRTQMLLRVIDDLLGDIEAQRPAYLVPHVLSELSLMRRFVAELDDELGKLHQLADQERLLEVPELRCLAIEPVPWTAGARMPGPGDEGTKG